MERPSFIPPLVWEVLPSDERLRIVTTKRVTLPGSTHCTHSLDETAICAMEASSPGVLMHLLRTERVSTVPKGPPSTEKQSDQSEIRLIKDADVSMAPLAGKTVAVLGFGNQGRAQALNLRDSGVNVIVGNRKDTYFDVAVKDGFEPVPIREAAAAGDILIFLTTDESQPAVWSENIAPVLRSGQCVVWASGYNVGYALIKPLPPDIDVVMIAPRMTGQGVRSLFVAGGGAIAQFAVHQDATGSARGTVMSLCQGMGLIRGGVFESSFREEAELDLFAEQVIWAGLSAWIVACFELGVEFGFAPELMAMELYASGEAAEIFDKMAANGFFKQMLHHSTTSQYGTLSRGPAFIAPSMVQRARELFQADIRGGRFVREWSEEQASGASRLESLRRAALAHPMSLAEDRIIGIVQAAWRTVAS